jgi:hypothetical protein
MIIIKDFNEIQNNLPKLGELFEIQKGNRKAIYKIGKNQNFGCLEVVRCENIGLSMGGTYITRETPMGGGGKDIEKLVKSAYDHT